ncbi:hypothetical protein PGT21_035726 [Puccinia graminis f. sp. tritici]|uniref:Uncharacterized protein n=1 Tax=Puccinia graminis f. sp. tritici TaxID=56615 RepID=A0A5B0QPX1_PUCGR|nr:hypothetical protein PGT21_035726 [Puccinia graminis f. sp. tritici]
MTSVTFRLSILTVVRTATWFLPKQQKRFDTGVRPGLLFFPRNLLVRLGLSTVGSTSLYCSTHFSACDKDGRIDITVLQTARQVLPATVSQTAACSNFYNLLFKDRRAQSGDCTFGSTVFCQLRRPAHQVLLASDSDSQ